MGTRKGRGRSLRAAALASLILLAATSCSAQPDEDSARQAVEEMRDGDFISSGSINRFGIDTVTVEGNCAVVRIIELPETYELSIFLHWVDGSWQGTNIITGHGAEIDPNAEDCWKN